MDSRIYVPQIPEHYRVSGLGRTARSIPLGVRLSLIFVNIWGLIGISFTLIGSLTALLLIPATDFTSPFYFGDSAAKIKGIVTTVHQTDSSENDEYIYKYTYTFEHSGRTITGESYGRGFDIKPQDSVIIEFEPKQPGISRIEGMRTKPFGIFVIIFLIFPVIGILFLATAYKKGMRYSRAIAFGILTRGKLFDKKDSGGRINDNPIYDMYFSFTDSAGVTRTAIGSTHHTEQLEDEAEERIVYDPLNPENAVVVDALPKNVRAYIARILGQ